MSKRRTDFAPTEEGWAFDEWLERTIASYPGATLEERVNAMAVDHPWMLEDLLTPPEGSDGPP